MHTFQIAKAVLEGYKNEKLGEERIDFLVEQSNKQLEEISQNQDLYKSFLERVNAPKGINSLLLWILFMSNEQICEEYINEFDKDFREIIPVSDLADLLFYVIYLKNVQETELDGLDYLITYDDAGIEEVDQYCFTNILLYIQKSKEVQMEF